MEGGGLPVNLYVVPVLVLNYCFYIEALFRPVKLALSVCYQTQGQLETTATACAVCKIVLQELSRDRAMRRIY